MQFVTVSISRHRHIREVGRHLAHVKLVQRHLVRAGVLLESVPAALHRSVADHARVLHFLGHHLGSSVLRLVCGGVHAVRGADVLLYTSNIMVHFATFKALVVALVLELLKGEMPP